MTRRHRRHVLATVAVSYLGCGLSPIAPGTVGTAGAALTAWLLLTYLPLATTHWWLVALAAAVLASLVTVSLTPTFESRSGKDPGVIVTDEVAGYFLTLAVVPAPTLPHLVAAFFLFRFFDIAKVWPGSAFEKLHDGWGVLLDDLMAGIYGAGVLALLTLV